MRLSGLNPKRNSIGLIRLIAAMLVIIGHAFPYGGFGVDPLITLTNNQLAIGRVPVDIFFCISGYLIAQSFLSGNGWRSFVWNRFLRIYPASLTCLVLTAFVIAPAVAQTAGYRYFAQNATLLFPVRDLIPGLLQDTPGKGTINSSLWTLPWELRAYAAVLLIGMTGLLRNARVLILVFVASWSYFAFLIFRSEGIQTGAAITSGARLLTFFLGGVLLQHYRERVVMDWRIFFIAVFIMAGATVLGNLFVAHSAGLFYLLAPIPLTYAVFFVAVKLPFWNINHEWDISYGIYIYGTLGLNLLAHAGLNSSFGIYLACALLFAMVTGTMSWFLVEKPALRLKSLVRSRRHAAAPTNHLGLDPTP